MLAYRHAFHAGNHADVLKHLVLVQLMHYLARKDKGVRIVDTHAGAGLYTLDSPQAQKKGEYLQGIARLWEARNPPAAVADYLEPIRHANADGVLRHYPGSPQLLQSLLRPQDQLRLFELHPTDHQALQALFGGARGVEVRQADGFALLRSQLPPPTRRGLVLIDPSYELKSDYAQVLDCVQDSLKRFATGTYLIWYPVIPRPEAHDLPRRLKTLAKQAGRPWLHATLAIGAEDAPSAPPGAPGEPRRHGLRASGMFVINPPHTLKSKLEPALASLLKHLGRGPGKGTGLEAEG